tara:strand:- start:3447 stop:3923 length:477 start_codon:yes stop_codon:yes gene_type:complete
MNYYEILGLEKNCSKEDIKSSYIKLAKKYHPDKGGCENMFKLVSEAYNILYDNKKRFNYDNNYILETYDTYTNPHDIFEEIINKSDRIYQESMINNYLFEDYEIKDNPNESVFFNNLNTPDNYSFMMTSVIKDGKKYSKKIISENGRVKEYEEVQNLI